MTAARTVDGRVLARGMLSACRPRRSGSPAQAPTTHPAACDATGAGRRQARRRPALSWTPIAPVRGQPVTVPLPGERRESDAEAGARVVRNPPREPHLMTQWTGVSPTSPPGQSCRQDRRGGGCVPRRSRALMATCGSQLTRIPLLARYAVRPRRRRGHLAGSRRRPAALIGLADHDAAKPGGPLRGAADGHAAASQRTYSARQERGKTARDVGSTPRRVAYSSDQQREPHVATATRQ